MEFALIAPMLFALLLGILDFGLLMNDLQGVRQGAREGTRQAAVGNLGTDNTCATTGLTPTATAEDLLLVCLTKDRVDGDQIETRIKIELDATDGYAEGAPIVVCVQYPVTSASGFFDYPLNNRAFTARVQMHIEEELATPGTLTSVEETPLAGADWSSCQIQ